ncbi:MAG: hypothetical protein H0W88_09365 [Parachlamydiaceae bacterium]|nr:hypothetical protein [Parachlamydiaceae bacterium]
MLTNNDPIKKEKKAPKSPKQENGVAIRPSSALTATSTATKPSKTSNSKTYEDDNLFSDKKKSNIQSKVTIKFDVGFKNHLTIRGKGANLSWEKGIALKNTKPDEWVWETDATFPNCEFKILINDKQYEAGENHNLKAGTSITYTPKF